MARLRIDKPVRAVLLDQLQAAGLAPLTPEGTSILQPDAGEGGGWLTVPDADEATARAVVAAHDAAAIDAAEAQQEAQDAGDLTRVRAAYANLKSDAAALRNDADTMPASLTAAQVRARLIQIERALAETNDTLAALVRYLARRLG